MPPPLIEIYRLILQKGFKPRIGVHGHEMCIILTHPNGKYSTTYLMRDGKFKWWSGVSPFRILK